jgi:hypothetical protein
MERGKIEEDFCPLVASEVGRLEQRGSDVHAKGFSSWNT